MEHNNRPGCSHPWLVEASVVKVHSLDTKNVSYIRIAGLARQEEISANVIFLRSAINFIFVSQLVPRSKLDNSKNTLSFFTHPGVSIAQPG